MEMVLGTAQFGHSYGVTNKRKTIDENELKKINQCLCDSSIFKIDTAPAYGDAQKKIGEHFTHKKFEIISKLPSVSHQNEISHFVSSSFNRTCQDLNRSSLYGLLFHRVEDLLGSNAQFFFDSISTLKEQGLVKKIGVSVYDPTEAEEILRRFPIDLIQIPMNIFDRRFKHAGTLKELKRRNVEIHVRSVFLQGVLIDHCAPDLSEMSSFQSELRNYFDCLNSMKLDPIFSCLQFLKEFKEIDAAVIGVMNHVQLETIVSTMKLSQKFDIGTFDSFDFSDRLNLIDPRKWGHV